MYETDLSKEVTKLDIPVYFCHGVYDCTDSYKLAKEYFEKLQVPIKVFILFDEFAHSPMVEETEKFSRILEEDVLKRKNSLAK